MWFEDLMLLALIATSIFLIGIPIYKFLKVAIPRKRNALAEAKERLEQARLEAAAARLNKEAEKIYEEIYQETLQDEEEIEFQQEKRK